MTYVASPSYPTDDPTRAANLRQCLETAYRHLDETSKASQSEKESELITSAVIAGWDEAEVRSVLSDRISGDTPTDEGNVSPSFGVVPSSSM